MSIYGKKNFKNLLNQWTDLTKLGMYHLALLLIIVCSNCDPGLTFTYFSARSNFVTGFSVEKSEKVEFSETVAACDLNLIELMKICQY